MAALLEVKELSWFSCWGFSSSHNTEQLLWCRTPGTGEMVLQIQGLVGGIWGSAEPLQSHHLWLVSQTGLQV